MTAALVLALVAVPASAGNANPFLVGGPHHPSPILTPGMAAASPRAHVAYFGGRVISSVQVVMVLWGDGPFAPFVADEAPPSMTSFLSSVTRSAYLDPLAQYDTTRPAVGGKPGTGQHIGRGTLAARVRITPAVSNDGPVIDDANIVAELAEQIASGALPPPALDAAGNVVTLYLVYFPAGKVITLGNDSSCSTLCAYHGAFQWDGRNVYYAALPDLSPGCDVGCGTGTPFAIATAVTSHELVEAITDPEVSLAQSIGAPLAWYDAVNGEVGDICNGSNGIVTSSDGSYVVQRLWSNADAACVAGPAPGAVALGPGVGGTGAADTAFPKSASRLGLRPASALSGMPGLPASPRANTPRSLASEPSELPAGFGSRFTVEEENDGLGIGPRRTDSFYTQGLRISSMWASRSPLAQEGREAIGFAIGQNIYTPTDIRQTDLQALRNDRPYAGWLYAALLWQLSLDDAPFSVRAGADAGGEDASTFDLEIAVGTTGPHSGAGAIQTNFHRLLRDLSGSSTSPPDPAGWSIYQTANQPTGDASIRYQFDALRASASLGEATAATGSLLALRMSPRVRFDIGSMYDAAWLGLEVRTGLMAASRRRVPTGVPVELYAFARLDGRYVAYNGFVESPLRNDVTTLVTIAPWVADLDVGIVARLGGLEFGYAQLWRTNELARVPPGATRIHNVGQARISFVY